MTEKRKGRKVAPPGQPRSITDSRLYEWEPRLISDKELFDSYERGDMPASALLSGTRPAYEAYLRKKKRFDLLGGGKSEEGQEADSSSALKPKKTAK